MSRPEELAGVRASKPAGPRDWWLLEGERGGPDTATLGCLLARASDKRLQALESLVGRVSSRAGHSLASM